MVANRGPATDWLRAFFDRAGVRFAVDGHGGVNFLRDNFATVVCDAIVVVDFPGDVETEVDEPDTAVLALDFAGGLIAHGLAVMPGEFAAVGRIAGRPILLMEKMLADVIGLSLLILRPVLARLSGLAPSASTTLPLSHKIVGVPGRTSIVWLRAEAAHLALLAVGDIPLHLLMRATHFAVLPAGHEGYPAGTSLSADPIL
jgi:molybdopterin biosynthesis enzyme